MIQEVQVRRAGIGEARLGARPERPLEPGEIDVAVRDFALTANNVTYAASGEMIGYWKFYPAARDAEAWGIVPVWGFAEVVRSLDERCSPGERFWGFLPMAERTILRPGARTRNGFVDDSPHRRELPAPYNQYALTAAEPEALAALADERSLLLPLFFTSFVLADFLEDNGFFGAERVIVGSASSKTGFGTGAYLAGKGVERIGLTSAGNRAFTESLGYFDRVDVYDDIDALEAGVASVFVDMAGSAAIRSAVHHRLGDALKASIAVGATHWDDFAGGQDLPGPRPQFFFAPAQIMKRETDWGRGEPQRRGQQAFAELAASAREHVAIERRTGPEAVRDAYAAMARGEIPPATGLILSFG